MHEKTLGCSRVWVWGKIAPESIGNNPNTLAILTTYVNVGISDNMKAQKVTEHKSVDKDGNIVQFVIWKVPTPVPPTSHGFKYRMVYIQDGERVVGFDNERGKGDHMHLDRKEYPYHFTTLDQLIEDFLSEIEKRRQS